MGIKVKPIQPTANKGKKIAKHYLKIIFSKYICIVTSVTSAIVIACSIIFFISPVVKENVVIPAHIYVYGNDLSAKVQEEINQSVASNIEKLYNQLLANIQLSIALFSCALVVFAIIFGWIYFSRIRDAENLIKEIQKTPDLFFKQFYREQYNKNISNMFSSNYVKRSEAIKNLTFNPEVGKEDYDVLQEVLLNELDYPANVYFYNNISAIIGVLIKIDHSRTLLLLRNILQEKEYDPLKFNNFLTYIIADNSSETRDFIQSKLSADSNMGTQIISMLLSNGLINDYSEYILEKCDGAVLQAIILHSDTKMWHIKTEKFYEHLIKRNDVDVQNLEFIVRNTKMSVMEKIRLVLCFYRKNQEEYDSALNTLINTISHDDKAKDDLLDIAKETDCEPEIKQFFNKNNQYKALFPNFFIDNLENAKKEARNPTDIIHDLGLYRNTEGVVIDAKGKKYDAKNYAPSFFGPWLEVQTGIMIGGVFISLNQITKQ
ncbi:MAG: hypothetical protein LBH80_01665 [Prevotellaceae bacterium]|jgi:hypothetical protein|nr:hypothetical protein [Prevotellaceae bacterium]